MDVREFLKCWPVDSTSGKVTHPVDMKDDGDAFTVKKAMKAARKVHESGFLHWQARQRSEACRRGRIAARAEMAKMAPSS